MIVLETDVGEEVILPYSEGGDLRLAFAIRTNRRAQRSRW